MKGSTKPVSSPSRTQQKFPPPLMRFLRSNVGSKSRGRSRSSSLFMRRKNTAAGVEITQEPSSPKVTCIGQVRVRRSANSAAAGVRRSESRRKTTIPPSSDQLPCWWGRKTLFCHGFSKKLCKPRPLPSLLRHCARFFGFGSCRGVDTAGSPARVDTEESSGSEKNGVKIGAFVQEDTSTSLGSSSSPPKNALLLTRCRSAPYRSSSLACRFWGSPLKPSTETDDSAIESKHLPQTLLLLVQEKPTSSPDCVNAVSGRSEESEDSDSSNGEKCREVSQETNNKVHPLLLTRCKSEPARTGERLIPDSGFWRLRRFAEPQPQPQPQPH